MPTVSPTARSAAGSSLPSSHRPMLCWYVGSALAAVWYVFRDQRFDVRLLVVGSLLPEVDALFGGARVMHTLAFSLALLALVMAATAGRKPARRLLLGLPIGTMLHLVFDGAWANTRVFAWPLGGFDFEGARLPVAERGWWNIPLELAGIALLLWFWRRAELNDPARRRELLHTGRLFAHMEHSQP